MARFNKTDDYTFANFCKTFGRFEIPNFQRPYSWKNKQLQDFFNSVVENEEVYFIGNIVGVDGKPLRIIDGQQRLTTISILLCVIRDLFLEIDPKNKEEEKLIKQRKKSINAYLFFEDLDEIPAKIYKRLFLGKEKYQSIFDKIVDGSIETVALKTVGDNEKRIINNYKILKKLLSNFISNSKIDRLEQVLRKTLSLQIILIVCDSVNDIYSIFEGFNSTGLGLSVADLVKNAVLRQSDTDTEIQNDVETVWIEMEELFETTSTSKFPKFLRHQWISEDGHVLMANLFNEIKNKKIDNKSPKEIFTYISGLTNDAKIYIGIMYQQYERLLEIDNDVLQSFRKFRFLRNDQVYEILLAYYKAYNSKKLRKATLQNFLKQIWIFVLRSRFISINPSDYEKIFAKHCEEVSNVNDSQEFSKYFDIFINKLKKLVVDDQQFADNFVSDVRYGIDNKLITEVFFEIMENENAGIQLKDPEIEHILPQSPKKWGLQKSEIREYVNNIGNLTLLFEGDNKDAKDEVMDFKAKIYDRSPFDINKEICSKWNDQFKVDWREAINKRGIEMANRISKIWKL